MRDEPKTGRSVAGSDAIVAALRHAFPGIDAEAMSVGLRERSLLAGDILCDEGDPADVAWIIVRGRLRVSQHSSEDGAFTRIGEIEAGEVIGEQALVEGGRRTARVTAIRRTSVVSLDRRWLSRLVAIDHGAVGHIIQAMDRRQQRSHLQTEKLVTIVPAGAPVNGVDRLVEQLRLMPGTVVLDSRSPEAASHTTSSDWIATLEAEHDHVILIADGTWTPWTETVSAVADRVVIAVDGDGSPDLADIEIRLGSVATSLDIPRTLVLLHPPTTESPTNTRQFLQRRPDDAWLHARIDRVADLSRVARHLTSNAVAVVIGGGGARSLGAIGAYHELRRRGVPVDALVGCSGGAVLGAAIAQGRDPLELHDTARAGFVKVNDPTFPAVSILRGRRLWDRLEEHLGTADIADTWVPFACVSTDLSTGELATHRTGPVNERVRASLSVPGVFIPVDIDGHLHVDGGVLDSLPVRAAIDLAPMATIIALDFTQSEGPQVTESVPRSASGWKWLFDRLIRRARLPSVPSITTTVVHSAMLGANRARLQSIALADVHLSLELGEFALLDFNRIDRLAATGARQASPMLDEWLTKDGAKVLRTEPWAHPVSLVTRVDPDLDTTRRRAVTGALFLAIADLRHRLRRFFVAVGAASVVLALLLIMTGVVGELDREPGVTTETIGASHWVLPDGIESPFTSNATFGPDVAAQIEATGDVSPALVARLPVTIDGETIDAILIGHADAGPGRPAVRDGTSADAPGEAALSAFAGASVGDEIMLGSTATTVSGVVADTTLFAGMPIVFVSIDEARALVAGGREVISTVLVAGSVESVPDGLHVLERAAIIESAKGPVERPILTLHLVQGLLAIVAAMIIGAVVYLASLERTRDIAVLRAVGTDKSMLALGVAVQALAMAVVASAVATVLQLLLSPVFPLTVYLTTHDRIMLPVIASIVAIIASYAAIRRVLRIDPSAAFAGAEG